MGDRYEITVEQTDRLDWRAQAWRVRECTDKEREQLPLRHGAVVRQPVGVACVSWSRSAAVRAARRWLPPHVGVVRRVDILHLEAGPR